MSSLNTPDCPIKYFSHIVKKRVSKRIFASHVNTAFRQFFREKCCFSLAQVRIIIFFIRREVPFLSNKKNFPHSIFTHRAGSFCISMKLYPFLYAFRLSINLSKPAWPSSVLLYTPASSSTCMNTSPISFWMMLWIFSAFTS